MSSAPEPTFLGIPLEIRQIIYNFCYAEPLSSDTHEWVEVPESGARPAANRENKRRRLHKRDNGTTKQLRRLTTNCHFPQCHLNLLLVSQRVRDEFFPVFAINHTFSFPDPLTFANEYLSYTPPHLYSNIRHLRFALGATTNSDKCGCVVAQACPIHGSHTLNRNSDMRNLVDIIDVYPELFSNLRSIRFDLSSCMEEFSTAERVGLLETTVLLVEEMNRRCRTANGENLKHLIALRATNDLFGILTQLDIFAVSNETFNLFIDEATVIRKGCMCLDTVQWLNRDRKCRDHENLWENIDHFVSALRRGKFEQDTSQINYEVRATLDPGVFDGRNWKVLLDGGHSIRSEWGSAVSELWFWNTLQGISAKYKAALRRIHRARMGMRVR